MAPTVTVVSDLHLEARPLSLNDIVDPELKSDVLCLLGDIGDPTSAAYHDLLAAVAARFPTVLILAGNNEYRNHDGGGRTMAQIEDAIRTAAAPYPNVRFLQNETHVLDGVAFIGTTLWSYLPDEPLPLPQQESPDITAAKATYAAASELATPAQAQQQQQQQQEGTAAAAGSARQLQEPVVTVRVMPASTTPAAGSIAAAVANGNHSPASTSPFLSADVQAAAAAKTPFTVVDNAVHGNSGQGTVAIPVAAGSGGAGRRVSTTALVMPRIAARSQPLTSALHMQQWQALVNGGGTPGRCSCGGAAGGDTKCPDASTSPAGPGPASPIAAALAARTGKGGCCRRRLLCRSVSLASLRPDDPIPNWRSHLERLYGKNNSSSASGSGSESNIGNSGSESDDSGTESDARSRRTGYDSHARSDDVDSDDGGASEVLASIAGSTTTADLGVPERPSRRSGSHSGSARPIDSRAAPALLSREPSAEAKATKQVAPVATAVQCASQTGSVTVEAAAPGPVVRDVLEVERSRPSALQPAAGSPPAAVAAAVVPSEPLAPGASPAATTQLQLQASAHTPTPRGHHHHHHHHHRKPSTSGVQALPPATIREYIAATSLDFRHIFAAPGGPPITPEVTNALFAASLEYVRVAVAAARARSLVPVVLSHHAPSMYGTCRPKFAGHPSTHAYGTDLVSFLADSGIAVWYCGHTHYNFDMTLPGGVRLASNQFGSQPQPAECYRRTWQHRLPSLALQQQQQQAEKGGAETGAEVKAFGVGLDRLGSLAIPMTASSPSRSLVPAMALSQQ